MTFEAHISTSETKIKRVVRSRTHQVLAVRCTNRHKTDTAAYYPEGTDRMKRTTRRRRIEIEVNNIEVNNKKGKGRNKVQFKQENKKENTKQTGRLFQDCRLANFGMRVEHL